MKNLLEEDSKELGLRETMGLTQGHVILMDSLSQLIDEFANLYSDTINSSC